MSEAKQTLEDRLEQERQSPGAPAPGGDAQGSSEADSQNPAPAVDGSDAPEGDEAAAGDADPTEVSDPTPEGDATEIEGDLDELVKTAAERDEYLALAQRTQADFENYRKRVARESAAAQERGVVKLAKELLPPLDNLDRALEAAAQDDPLLDGVRLVRSELSAALGRLGIESFCPVGEAFDPAEHEAMAQQPVAGAESGTVVEVYQPGYRLGAIVIRPARVLVAA